jgi:hypothetical protein
MWHVVQEYRLQLQYILNLVSIAVFVILSYILATRPLNASSESSEYLIAKAQNSKGCAADFKSRAEIEVQAEIGDLIEFRRYLGVYDHWGIYVGGGNVVHLTVNSQTGSAVIKKERLTNVSAVWAICSILLD